MALDELLPAAQQVRNVEDAWLLLHMLFELIWQYRFLYRDLNDLLSRNRRLEKRFQAVLAHKSQAVRGVIDALAREGVMRIDGGDAAALSVAMVVLLTYWLSFEYVLDPRHALEPQRAAASMGRGAWHVLALLLPHLDPASRAHLRDLAAPYERP